MGRVAWYNRAMKSSVISLVLAAIVVITGILVFREKPEPFKLQSTGGISITGFMQSSEVPALQASNELYFDEAVNLYPANLKLSNPYSVYWPADKSLFIYDTELESWREYSGTQPAELYEFTRLATGDPVTVEEVDNLTLLDELKNSSPAGTVGYTLNEVISVDQVLPPILITSKREEGGCDGIFRTSADKRRSERAQKLQLLINDRLETANIRLFSDWYVDSLSESCKIEPRN